MPDTPVPWVGLAALVAMLLLPYLPEWLFEGPPDHPAPATPARLRRLRRPLDRRPYLRSRSNRGWLAAAGPLRRLPPPPAELEPRKARTLR